MQLALSTQTNQQQQQQGGEKPQRGSRTQTWREKLRLCRSLEPKRITFGKSGIHGWGIFARRPIAQDSMVTEFRGQLVRQIMADVREVAYRKQVRARLFMQLWCVRSVQMRDAEHWRA
jgi:SET domain-containing protein